MYSLSSLSGISSVGVVAGASGDIGKSFLRMFSNARHTASVAISRSQEDLPYSDLALTFDVGSPSSVHCFVSSLPESIRHVYLVHSIGTFDYDAPSSVTKPSSVAHFNDSSASSVWHSNYWTFVSLMLGLEKWALGAQKRMLTSVYLGSISDPHEVPMWLPFSQANRAAKRWLKQRLLHPITGENIHGVVANLSTVSTESERNLRPYADSYYWLEPSEVVGTLADRILSTDERLIETSIFKDHPDLGPDCFSNPELIHHRWMRQMYGSHYSPKD
jgi:NAD(P)-dependent dehydrogenase (short-subunit alcohol dehydrogenase family)